MAITARRLTFEDLELIPEEHEGDRHELIDGELVVTPSPIPAHQLVSRNLFRHLDRYVSAGDLGETMYAPVDVRLTRDNVFIPDIIFIARDRMHIIGPKTIDAAPDLVIEILSSGTRRRDLTVKRDLYARFGVQEYWIVDPDTRTVTVLALTGETYETIPLTDGGMVQSRVLSGLELDLVAVFMGITAS